MNSDESKQYVTALRFPILTAIYDPVVKWTTRELHIKDMMIQESMFQESMRVLDVGCGTGTLAFMLAEHRPDIEVFGIDGDKEILSIAERKRRDQRLAVQFDYGMAEVLPYEQHRFDRVFSTLFFHHLNDSQKAIVLSEIFRVLEPGGEFVLADWGKPSNILMRCLFTLVRLLDGFENTRANVEGELPGLMRQAGFQTSSTHRNFDTALGTISLYKATKPRDAS